MSTVTQVSPPPADVTTWQTLRAQLEQQRAVCLRQHEEAVVEAATSVPDPVALSRAAGLAARIGEIDDALDRIAVGSYGSCLRCGVPIPVERLELRPFAAGCVACQAAGR